MAGLNKIMVIGNAGTDAEMRYTPGGEPVTSFRIATNRTFNTREGERREETEWFTVVAWRQLAEQVNQYVTKGRRVFVEGRLRSRSWTGQDGQQRFVNEIIASQVLFLDRAAEGGMGEEEGGQAPAQAQESKAGAVDPQDLPF